MSVWQTNFLQHKIAAPKFAYEGETWDEFFGPKCVLCATVLRIAEYDNMCYWTQIWWAILTTKMILISGGSIIVASLWSHVGTYIWVKIRSGDGFIWWYRSWSTLAQVMACCLIAPSRYLNPCWLIVNQSSAALNSSQFQKKCSRYKLGKWV